MQCVFRNWCHRVTVVSMRVGGIKSTLDVGFARGACTQSSHQPRFTSASMSLSAWYLYVCPSKVPKIPVHCGQSWN